MLISILYISYMKKEYEEEEIKELINNFYSNNLKYNVSGLLLYNERNIIQYIEGEEDVINNLYNNIICDTRHWRIITLYKNRIENRLFMEWKGFTYIERDVYNNFINSCIKDDSILILFNSFLKVNGFL